jgi:hypothetical protein
MQIAAPAVIGGGYGAYQEGDLAGIGMYAAGGAALPFLAQKAINFAFPHGSPVPPKYQGSQ